MSNTLTNIIPKILAQGLKTLREAAVFPRIVNTDFSDEVRQKGATIDVPIPSALTATAVSPGSTPITPGDSTPTLVQVNLNQWYHASFHLTDKEMGEVEANNFIPGQVDEAAKALANVVNKSVAALYTGIYGFVGTPGTTPFGSSMADAVNARVKLQRQLAPMDPRWGVLDPDAAGNALLLEGFRSAEKIGSDAVVTSGQIGRKLGINWIEDQSVDQSGAALHTQGTLGGGTLSVSGAHAAAASDTTDTLTIACSGGTGATLYAGDIITIAGHDQTYVITANASISAGATTACSIAPGLQTALPGSEAITLKYDATAGATTYKNSLVFHRDAFALAVRPLEGMQAGSIAMQTMIDSVTGLPLRLEITRQNKQTVWDFDILWGVVLARPQLACRIAG